MACDEAEILESRDPEKLALEAMIACYRGMGVGVRLYQVLR